MAEKKEVKPASAGLAIAGPAPTVATLQPEGLTVRDWLAGQAIMGWLAYNGGPGLADDMRAVARRVYALADAMMAERKGTS